MSRLLELFGLPTTSRGRAWTEVVRDQQCPYLNRKCVKVRKSQPDLAIGTCAVSHGQNLQPLVICPHRLIQNSTVFVDCIHLLTRHRPGNQFHGYEFETTSSGNRLQLVERLSTDAKGVEKCLGLQTSPNIDLDAIVSAIERRLSDDTVLNVVSS